MVRLKLFFDTNVWLRYFIADEEESFRCVKRLIEFAEEGKLKIATSTFVLSEFVYVEQSFYQIEKEEIVSDLEGIASVKGIKIVEKTNFKKALELFKLKKEKKWSDCIIVSQVPKDYLLCSFDRRLRNLIGKDNFISPQKALQFLT